MPWRHLGRSGGRRFQVGAGLPGRGSVRVPRIGAARCGPLHQPGILPRRGRAHLAQCLAVCRAGRRHARPRAMWWCSGECWRTYLVVRQAWDGSVRAFHNVCLHRGRQAAHRKRTGRRCSIASIDGFAWNLDGSLNEIPCRWDFSHLKDDKMNLPEAETGRWGGYIFLRENPGGPTPRGVHQPPARAFPALAARTSAPPPSGSPRLSTPTGRP